MENESGYFFDEPRIEAGITSELIPVKSSPAGFCELYRSKRDGKLVIYKCLKPQYRGLPDMESLLRKEFEIGYGLDHPGICRILSFETVRNLGKCIIMEWIDGYTLSEFCGNKTLPKQQAYAILRQICDVLEYIHSRQIVHRDLKPDNVMITRNGCNVKLIDFGLADTDSHCIHKEPAGTRSYASPEQIQGVELDGRSDIYSLGIMIKEIAGPAFSKIASHCMRVNRDLRYQTATEVREAIERLVHRPSRLVRVFAIIALSVILSAVAYRMISNDSAADSSVPDYDTVIQDATQAIMDLQDSSL